MCTVAGDRGQGPSSSSVVVVREDADEYDPGRPNDFEEVRRSREVQRKEAELEVGRQERLRLEALQQQVGRDLERVADFLPAITPSQRIISHSTSWCLRTYLREATMQHHRPVAAPR